MKNSNIEWTNHTFNPWIGCTKVSPGCAHCYAEHNMDTRFGRVKWGSGKPRSRTSPANWKQPRAWNRAAEKKGTRERVFCASLADVLDKEVPREWLTDLLTLVMETPHLDWLLLTKREDELERIPQTLEAITGRSVAPNIWLGVSAENQAMWTQRVPVLLSIPAVVRFVSAEPLLGPIAMGRHKPDWLIVGGESGPKCRPMAEEWVRSLRDQCGEGTAFHFKQWGGANKSARGRILDGRTWDGLPVPRNAIEPIPESLPLLSFSGLLRNLGQIEHEVFHLKPNHQKIAGNFGIEAEHDEFEERIPAEISSIMAHYLSYLNFLRWQTKRSGADELTKRNLVSRIEAMISEIVELSRHHKSA